MTKDEAIKVLRVVAAMSDSAVWELGDWSKNVGDWHQRRIGYAVGAPDPLDTWPAGQRLVWLASDGLLSVRDCEALSATGVIQPFGRLRFP